MDVRADDNCRLWTATTGHGKPLVMCHGGPGLWDMTGSLAAVLAPRLSVIRWDQRGCGRSERRGPYSVARCAADLEIPVLIIDGQRDLRPRWAVDSLERALPRVTRVILPGAGHILWLEAPKEFVRSLAEFLL
jgi:proline iminopeptidase